MISLYGTAGNMAKMSVQQTKVEQKKREGFVKKDGMMVKYQKTPEELQKEQLRQDAENAEKNRKMLEIEGKVESGRRLSPDEEKYLMENSPDLYRDYKEVQSEKENYKDKLKACKTKEEVDRTKMFEMGKALSSVNKISSNPNIPEGAKIGMLKKIMGQVMGIEEVDADFKQSLRYKQLIDTDEEKREIENENLEEITGQEAVEKAQAKEKEIIEQEEAQSVSESEQVKSVEAVSDKNADPIKSEEPATETSIEKKRKNPAPYREDIHIDFDDETTAPKGNVTAEDVVNEIVNYVNDHRGTGEGLGMLQGNIGFIKK